DDVRMVRMAVQEILMIGFGWIESLKRIDTRNDGLREYMGAFELRDIGLCYALLRRVGIENNRTVLRPSVRALTILFCWVVRHREIDPQNFAVGNLPRVEDDL